MPKVLIADDNPQVRRSWSINLSARGYDVVEASDGLECLSLIEEESPDVILLDLNMPLLSGWDVLDTLKAGGVVVTTGPVIVVSGLAGAEIESRARQLGAVGVLFKPFGVDQLLVAVEQAVRGTQN